MNATTSLTSAIPAFCALLRDEHGFDLGPREAHDALRAIEAVGVADRARVRCALRLVCCAAHGQTPAFDRAFEAFFDASRPGVQQSAYAPRHTRPGARRPRRPMPRGRARRTLGAPTPMTAEPATDANRAPHRAATAGRPSGSCCGRATVRRRRAARRCCSISS